MSEDSNKSVKQYVVLLEKGREATVTADQIQQRGPKKSPTLTFLLAGKEVGKFYNPLGWKVGGAP